MYVSLDSLTACTAAGHKRHCAGSNEALLTVTPESCRMLLPILAYDCLGAEMCCVMLCDLCLCFAGTYTTDDRQGQGSSISAGRIVGLWSLHWSADPGTCVCTAEGEHTMLTLSYTPIAPGLGQDWGRSSQQLCQQLSVTLPCTPVVSADKQGWGCSCSCGQQLSSWHGYKPSD